MPLFKPPFKISAGTLSSNRSDLTFSNGSGVSFGLNTDGNLTAAVATSFLASNASTNFVQANAAFAGTSASGTIASSGISINIGPYITTARRSTDALGLNTAGTNLTWTANSSGLSIDAGAYAFTSNTSKFAQAWELTGNTQGTTSSSQGTKWYFDGGNSITVSGNSNSIKFSVGNYITTARRSTDALGLGTAKTNVTWTANSDGLSFDASGYAGTATTVTTTAGTDLKLTVNSAGVNVAHPAWITAAAGANPLTVQDSATTLAVTKLIFSNINSVSFGLSTGVNIATVTASVPAFLTTAANSTHSHGNPTLNLTNLNGTTASASNGFTLSLSVFATTAAQSDHSHGNPTLNLTNLSGTTASASNGFTLSLSAGAHATLSGFTNIQPVNDMVTGASAITQTSGSSMFIQPFLLPQNISVGFVRLLASFNASAVGTAGTTSNNTTFTCERYTTIGMVIYSQGVGASSRSIQSVSSTSAGMTARTRYSGGTNGSAYTIALFYTYPASDQTTNAYTTQYAVSSGSIVISSNSNTLFTGPRFLDISWNGSLSAGNYWLGIGASTSSASQTSHISFAGSAAIPVSLAGVSNSNVTFGILGATVSASDHQLFPALGVWTTNASIFTKDSIAMSQVSQVASNPQLPFMFIRSA